MDKKIKMLLDIIKSNGINKMKEIDLINLLSDLTYEEFEYLLIKSVNVFGPVNRISKLENVIKHEIGKKIDAIKQSDYYLNFLTAIDNNNYIKYIESLSSEELHKVKRVVLCTFPDDVKEKIVFFIKEEINKKEQNKNLKFE